VISTGYFGFVGPAKQRFVTLFPTKTFTFSSTISACGMMQGW
jgi:hypothetical protein